MLKNKNPETRSAQVEIRVLGQSFHLHSEIATGTRDKTKFRLIKDEVGQGLIVQIYEKNGDWTSYAFSPQTIVEAAFSVHGKAETEKLDTAV